MIALDRNALICDLAEIYQIFDYRQVPVKTLAILAKGLPTDARIKTKLAGLRVPLYLYTLCEISDKLSIITWMMSEDGRTGKNKPEMLSDRLRLNYTPDTPKAVKGFRSGDDFEREKEKIMKGGAADGQ
jgi:hypothetical protein